MSDYNDTKKPDTQKAASRGSTFSRRSFLKYAGASAAAVATVGLVGCDDDDEVGPGPGPGEEAVVLGSGDPGILNFAYALEQLEAAFYAKVVANPYGGISNEESDILQDIADHEETHRAFFEAALSNAAPDKMIGSLTPDFSKVDFTSRASVLGTAKTFEDLGVSAYNGQGQYIQTKDYLLLAGKIVSVEARHASAIRDLLNPKSADFAGDDIVDAQTGLGVLNSSADVLAAASAYIEDDIDASGLPDQQ